MPLHEWKGFVSKDPLSENLITWLFEEDSFSPIAKLRGNKKYSILADHLGTPIEAYADNGNLVWERSLNANGKVLKETGIQNFCPFLYQGQSLDNEIELAYNRFRYYDVEDGRYISQDPIGLLSGEFGFYNYVEDTNDGMDVFGLSHYKNKMLKNGSRRHRKPGPKKKKGRKKKSSHGNSLQSKKTNYLYAKFDKDGNFLKWGKTDDLKGRYSLNDLNDGKIEPLDKGNIRDIKKIERELAEKVPGIDNLEPWAGTNSQPLSNAAQNIYNNMLNL